MTTPDRYLITGGAGFIGSALVRHLIAETPHTVLVVDKLSYAGNLDRLSVVERSPRYHFCRADVCDRPMMTKIVDEFRPGVVMHLAAESHVDRSIDDPGAFIETNVIGTFVLLEAALSYWKRSPASLRQQFRFHHISTDEVFGSLDDVGRFSESSPYRPSSPYAASKASSDHLVRAWHQTFGLPVIVTNCSNNYGSYQYPEKLIPLMILQALEGRPLPVYGQGLNVRDWLYVDDHVHALLAVVERGRVGETYNIGGNNELTNISVVELICDLLDELAPNASLRSHRELITYVADRPGHDLRYAIDGAKIEQELGFRPTESFDTGLRKTVAWYLANRDWCGLIRSGSYRGERLGLRRTIA